MNDEQSKRGGRLNQRTLLGKVKDAIDYIYELTANTPYRGGFSEYEKVVSDTARILVGRNIISREQDHTKTRRAFIYKWVATMAPTDTLYKSVTQELRDTQRRYEHNCKSRKKEQAQQDAPAEVVGIRTDNAEPVFKISDIPSFLKSLPAQDLWDELKRRGYTIEDNRLVLIKKDYLE